MKARALDSQLLDFFGISGWAELLILLRDSGSQLYECSFILI